MPAVSISLVDEDLGQRAIEENLEKLDGSGVDIGLFNPDDATKAWRHEKGEGVPRRRFLSLVSEQALAYYFALGFDEMVERAHKSNTVAPHEVLRRVGKGGADEAKYILEAGLVDGKELSAAAKRLDPRKLIHSKKMLRNIRYKYKLGGAVE